MKCVILAADKSKHKCQVVKNVISPLLSIRGVPVIEYTVNKIQAIKDIDHIYVVINRRSSKLLKRWVENYYCRIPITFIDNGTHDSRNLPGAVSDLAGAVDSEGINDDVLSISAATLFSFSLFEFIDFAKRIKPHSVVGVYEVNGKYKPGKFKVIDVDVDKKIVGLRKDPFNRNGIKLVSADLYFFSKETLGLIKDYLTEYSGRYNFQNYVQWFSHRGTMYAYTFEGKCFNVDDSDAYAEAVFTF